MKSIGKQQSENESTNRITGFLPIHVAENCVITFWYNGEHLIANGTLDMDGFVRYWEKFVYRQFLYYLY